MKKKMLSLMITATVVSSFMTTVSYAESSGFRGGAGYYFETVSQVNVKSDNNTIAYVNWSTSDDSNSHREWFRMKDYGNGNLTAAKLVDYLGGVTYQANNPSNKVYVLQAHREHIVNPFTYITGTWAP